MKVLAPQIALPERAPTPATDSPPVRRVLFILQSVAVGGMETHSVDLAGELIGRGIEIATILPEDCTFDALADRFCTAGAWVERLDTDARRGRLAQARGWLRLAHLVATWDPDVLHLQTGGATGGLAVLTVGRLFRHATVILTEHDVPCDQPGLYQRVVRRLINHICHAVIAVSRRNAAIRSQRLGGAPKLAAILNGVPIQPVTTRTRMCQRRRTRAASGLTEDAVVIGSVVRLADGKGLPELLRAFAVLRRKRECELLLVGDGPLRADLECLADELAIADHVHLAGHQRAPEPFMDAMDVFVLPVPSGSMSIALLEAMARGLPPVITFCGPEEAVIPELTGLAAPPNDPAGLADVLERLVADRDLRTRLGTAAAAHVRQCFSVERVADDVLELYAVASSQAVPAHLRADSPPNPFPGHLAV